MAGKLKEEKRKKIRETLQALQCPYLEGLDDISIDKLVFSLGEARLRLLEWLLEMFHPQLLHQKKGSNTTSRINNLVFCFADLQLCSEDDIELIKGIQKNDREIQFLEVLTDLVYITQRHVRINSEVCDCCNFVDELCHKSDLSSLMPSSISLVPPVIGHLCNIDSLSSNQVSIPSLTDLQDQVSNLNKQLIEKEKQLKQLKDTHSYIPVDLNTLSTCCQSLQVLTTTLTQLINDFIHQYNVYVKLWTVRDTVTFNALGPSAKGLHSHLNVITELLNGVNLIMASSSQLNELSTSLITVNDRDGTFYSKTHLCFQEYIDWLHD